MIFDQNLTSHHPCPQITALAQNTRTNRIQSHFTHLQHTSILPAPLSSSTVHGPTTSLNSFLFQRNTSAPLCHLIIKICKSLHSHSGSASLEQTPTSSLLRQVSDSSYELTKTSPLAISPQVFHSKLKILLFQRSYPDSSSSPYTQWCSPKK